MYNFKEEIWFPRGLQFRGRGRKVMITTLLFEAPHGGDFRNKIKYENTPLLRRIGAGVIFISMLN